MTKRKWNLPLPSVSGLPVKWWRCVASSMNQARETVSAPQRRPPGGVELALHLRRSTADNPAPAFATDSCGGGGQLAVANYHVAVAIAAVLCSTTVVATDWWPPQLG
jgi:hypothetical protein